ncbi:unnamed protein product [Calicophoron daubneyi]|uniref:Arf-GAP domain-containing protein n=1 Tax=Calicophoron daubneyi TaxID=300641 RepID=A0AAV2TIN0_CALDB
MQTEYIKFFIDPRWVSWNLGVFLCIRCASFHRQLGTHISKVKSIQLDSWNNEQLKILRCTNNIKSRKFYEGTLPGCFIRPTTDSGLEQFIRAKYEYKKFIKPPEKKQEKPSVICFNADHEQPVHNCQENDLINFECAEDLASPANTEQLAPSSEDDFKLSICALYADSEKTSRAQCTKWPPTPVPAAHPGTTGQSAYLNQVTQQLAAIKAQQQHQSYKTNIHY